MRKVGINVYDEVTNIVRKEQNKKNIFMK